MTRLAFIVIKLFGTNGKVIAQLPRAGYELSAHNDLSYGTHNIYYVNYWH